MNIQETNKCLALIAETYPAFMKDRDASVTANLWQTIFADETYQEVMNAIIAFISTDTKGFYPAPGAIKEQLAMFRKTDEMTEGEAWAIVSKAIRRGLYNSREEFEKFPNVIKSVVGTHEMLREWAMMSPSEIESVVASNFQRSYRARATHVREYEKLPSSIKSLCTGISEMLAFPQQDVVPALPDYTGTGSVQEEGCQIPADVKSKIEKLLGIST